MHTNCAIPKFNLQIALIVFDEKRIHGFSRRVAMESNILSISSHKKFSEFLVSVIFLLLLGAPDFHVDIDNLSEDFRIES